MTSVKALKGMSKQSTDTGASPLKLFKQIRDFDMAQFKALIKEALAELVSDGAIESAPFAYSVKGAVEAFPGVFSEPGLRRLIREEAIAVRYNGSNVVIMGDSLRAFLTSCPATRQVERECAANRDRGVA